MKKIYSIITLVILASCSSDKKITPTEKTNKLEPAVITEKVNFDTDDPAIWINPKDASKSLIIGTDKDTNGGLFVFDLNGKIVQQVKDLKRPNNVDLEYGLPFNGKNVDFVATTERETNSVKIYEVPSMKEIGSFSVFEGEEERAPMGIAIYKNPTTKQIDVIVGRKSGPKEDYLWQYKLVEKNGKISAELIRKFGKYSGIKEIESIAIDDALGYVYYSDEKFGVHQYYADASKGKKEIALFGKEDFTRDIEGISIYPTSEKEGYILVSDQQVDKFNIYKRENPKAGKIASISVSTSESDGSDVTAVNLGEQFPNGAFVAMSNGKVFHYYDWRNIQKEIDAQATVKK